MQPNEYISSGLANCIFALSLIPLVFLLGSGIYRLAAKFPLLQASEHMRVIIRSEAITRIIGALILAGVLAGAFVMVNGCHNNPGQLACSEASITQRLHMGEAGILVGGITLLISGSLTVVRTVSEARRLRS